MSSSDRKVAVIWIDNPPVNALSSSIAAELASRVQDAADEPAIEAIILIGTGTTFVAGADIRQIARIAAGEEGPLRLASYLEAIENCPKPVIAAIHGAALGGGLELAMAAHVRVIVPEGTVGLPEVKLGLIPGAGGTQRLPRLIGMSAAATMCTSGESVTAQAALAMGLVDRILEGNLEAEAVRVANEIAGQPFRRTKDRDVVKEDLPEIALPRGAYAPQRALAAIRASGELSFADGCRREAELFAECLRSSESKALIYGFFAERSVAKLPTSSTPLPVAAAAVIGAGTMGSGIALTLAAAGIPVLLKETSGRALEQGMAAIQRQFSRAVEKHRIASGALELIHPQLDWTGVEAVDLIVEAAFEDLHVKRSIFAALDGIAKPGCILASNTSSLNLDLIAGATGHPESVVGMHFFSPAFVMRLIEVVRGRLTSDQVVNTVMALGKRLGKTSVLSQNGPGFIGNRAFYPYLRQARFLVEEGASVHQVNAALCEWGMAMGPLAVDDLTGIDVSVQIENQLNRTGTRKPLLTEILLKSGRLGQKNGAGWSKYDASQKPCPDLEVAAMIEETSQKNGIERRSVQAEEIVDRCIFAMINEGARILEEGIAMRPVDIDVTFLKGFGFPAWRGGPMFYADTIGLAKVLRGVKQIDEPAALLRKRAESGRTFQSPS